MSADFVRTVVMDTCSPECLQDLMREHNVYGRQFCDPAHTYREGWTFVGPLDNILAFLRDGWGVEEDEVDGLLEPTLAGEAPDSWVTKFS